MMSRCFIPSLEKSYLVPDIHIEENDHQNSSNIAIIICLSKT